MWGYAGVISVAGWGPQSAHNRFKGRAFACTLLNRDVWQTTYFIMELAFVKSRGDNLLNKWRIC